VEEFLKLVGKTTLETDPLPHPDLLRGLSRIQEQLGLLPQTSALENKRKR